MTAILLLFVAFAAALTPAEREIIGRHRVLLEASPDPCRLAPRLEAEYKAILGAAPGPDATPVLAAVEGRPGIPLRLGEGIRILEGFALYDETTAVVYLSSPSVAPRLIGPGGDCPSDARLRGFAFDTVGVYLHEVTHSFDRKDLGPGLVATVEGELLAYAREARFLAGLPRWPSKAVRAEVERRVLVRRNQEVLGWVERLKDEHASSETLDKLQRYIGILEGIRRRLPKLDAARAGADPLAADISEMTEEYKKGWPQFVAFSLRRLQGRPSLGDRERNLAAALPFRDGSLKDLKDEPKGTLAYQLLERSAALGTEDVAFWGDTKRVERTLKYYKARFKELRPSAKP